MGTFTRQIFTIFTLIWVLLAVNPAQAFDSKEAVGRWFTNYYQNPEPAKVAEALQYALKAGLLEDKKAIPPMVGFLAGFFRNNPEKVSGLIETLKPTEEPILGVVVLGIWYAGLPDARERAHAILAWAPKQQDRYQFIYETSMTGVGGISLEQGPWVLDLLWGNFMATGDKAPVVRIISALAWLEVKGDTNKSLIAGAAKSALASNARQHPRVLKICQEEALKQPKEIAVILQEIIKNAN